jgi:hypothetical protein
MFKKILALMFLSFLFIMWGCGSKEGDPEKDDRDKPREEQNDDEDTKTGIKGLDDFVDNMKEMQENFEEGKEVETVNFRELKALLPEALDGFKRTSASGEKNNAFGINVSQAEGEYETEDNSSSISITIVDMGSMSGWAGLAAFGWTMGEIDKETDDGYERTIEYKGCKGYEEYNTESNYGKKEIMVAKRFMVTVDGNNVSMNAINDALDEIDIDELEKMKQVSENK